MQCYCGSKKDFSGCCEPFLNYMSKPSMPEQLMRSRYTAYVLGNGEYVVNTTTKENRYEDDIEFIKEYSKTILWLSLDILHVKEDIVEFKAYYKDAEGMKVQHERSNFVYENGKWFYDNGKLFNSKIDRNQPCPCKSGKKYKKCCDSKSS